MKTVKLWQSKVFLISFPDLKKIQFLAVFCQVWPNFAGLGKRYLQLRTTLTFRETGNVRLVLEAWQTKTLNRSSLVRDLYTIVLTIIELTTCFHEFFENESPIFFNNNISYIVGQR